jgi:hypothetical protein
MKFFQLILGLFLFSGSFAMAEVEWEREEMVLVVHPIQRKASAEFKFRNAGKKAVDFLSLRPSCGCLSIYPQKKHYQPGESGTLKVVFDLANRSGPQEKTVKVVTSDNPARIKKLVLKVNIPEAYRLSATRLLWKENQREMRAVTLVNISGQAIAVGRVTSSDPHLKIELKTIREGFEYRLELTPDPEVGNIRSVIRIETVPPKGIKESKGYRIYARIE